jgi:lipoate-protein ligase B
MEDMKWFSDIMSCGMSPKSISFALNLMARYPKKVWTGKDGDSGAGLTMHHHSLDSYMEDMKWFSSISPCGMSPNSIVLPLN